MQKFTKDSNSPNLAKAYIHFEESRQAQAGGSVTGNAADALDGKKAYAGPSENGSDFTVQFNPVELQFSTERGSKKKKKDLQAKGKKAFKKTYIKESVPGIHMSARLIFDAGFSETNDVQRKTEGLIAAAKSSAGDIKASFCWENFVFTGILESVSAEYTMFDEGGHPLRSDVDFTISLTDKEKMAEILNSDYRELFS